MDRGRGKIVIADGDEDALKRTSSVLRHAGYETVGAVSGVAALEAARVRGVALVVLEVALPEITGYEVLREIRNELGETFPVMFLTGVRTEPIDRTAGLLLGADDFVTKPFDADDLVARVAQLMSGGLGFRHIDATKSQIELQLTPRELEVLALLGAGKRQDDIAQQLVISENTVAKHIQNLLGKFGVHSRTELIARAYQIGYLVGVSAVDKL